MRKLIAIAAMLSVCGIAGAQARTEQEVLDHHGDSVKKGDLEAVMSDYGDDSIVMVPHKLAPKQPNMEGESIFVGKEQIRKLFEAVTAKDNLATIGTLEVTNEPVGHHTTLLHWVQLKGTPKEIRGMDLAVVQGDKIAYQILFLHPKK